MLQAEDDIKYGAFSFQTFAIVVSRIGMEDQQLKSGRVKSLIDKDYGVGPHSIIIPASLHFTELDAIKALSLNFDEPVNNTVNMKKLSVKMIENYAPKAREAAIQLKSVIKGENKFLLTHQSVEILDNAECYIDDAERFLKQGKYELAVLSMGYAEGLIDALRMQRERPM